MVSKRTQGLYKCKMKVVICGGGIIGNCVAYYLGESGITDITVVERDKLANAASGKAGGFLARDWCCECRQLDIFAKTSFALHQELATKFDGKASYDYRRLEAFSASYDADLKKSETELDSKREHLKWFNGPNIVAKSCNSIGTNENVAQLHPYKFVDTIAEYNLSRGIKVLEDTAIVSVKTEKAKAVGVELSNQTELECDVLVLCMGPWTGAAIEWFDSLPSCYGQKGHSIVILPKTELPGEAVFMELGGQFSPEIYPRPDGQVYVCGVTENPLPSNDLPLPGTIKPTENSCEKLKDIAGKVSDILCEGEVLTSQACYLPLTHDGLPIIGKVPQTENVYVAAGHGCWGILNSAATGKSLAQLITGCNEDEKINIEAFNPGRFN
uniref:FAD dependent oxidoreductase domain-containing protein n=2 Tax=Ciona intestinalis TaxID=7719 RepID=H2XT65_CIOIN